VILPKANHDWVHLCLHDYKSPVDYNHVVHKICAKLHFCKKEPSDEKKIEKTLTIMLPLDRILKHQYHARNYHVTQNLCKASFRQKSMMNSL
jgi:hypothetical protein